MKQRLGLAAIVVHDYDEAIAFSTETLGFELVEDTFLPEEQKRWVVVAPPGAEEPNCSSRAEWGPSKART